MNATEKIWMYIIIIIHSLQFRNIWTKYSLVELFNLIMNLIYNNHRFGLIRIWISCRIFVENVQNHPIIIGCIEGTWLQVSFNYMNYRVRLSFINGELAFEYVLLSFSIIYMKQNQKITNMWFQNASTDKIRKISREKKIINKSFLIRINAG